MRFPDDGLHATGTITQRVPNWDGGEPEVAKFDSPAALFAIPWVAWWRTSDVDDVGPFYRVAFGQRNAGLMAEFNRGKMWFLVGRVDAAGAALLTSLPRWTFHEPEYIDARKAAVRSSHLRDSHSANLAPRAEPNPIRMMPVSRHSGSQLPPLPSLMYRTRVGLTSVSGASPAATTYSPRFDVDQCSHRSAACSWSP